MLFFFKQCLNCGDKVYIVDGGVSSWEVSEVISAGHSQLYKLKKGESFCMYEQSRIGKDVFTSKGDALKELERRKDGKDKKIFKKL